MVEVIRRSTVGGVLTLGIVVGVAMIDPAAAATAAPHATALTQDPVARYRACVAKADNDPSAAAVEARVWAKEGGGEAARLCAAAANLALGRPKDAAEEFELLAAAPGSPQRRAALLAQAADGWVQAGSPDRAVAVLTEALDSNPNDAAMLVQRARAQVEMGRFSEAADDLTRAIDADSLQVEVYVLRASALRRAGRLDEAAFDLDTALMLDRTNPDALLERGLLRRGSGDSAGAREDWETVVKTAPGSAAAMLAQRHLDHDKDG